MCLSFILCPASLICHSATLSSLRTPANMIRAHSGKAGRFLSEGAGCKQTVAHHKKLLHFGKVEHLKALSQIKTLRERERHRREC